MSLDVVPFAEVLLISLAAVVMSAAAFEAFKASRVLANRVYRTRAIWSGVLAILFVPFDVVVVVFLPGFRGASLVAYGSLVFLYAFNLAAFFFLDTTILVARELDFLHRDPARWTVTRWIVLAVIVLGIAGVYLGPSTGPVQLTFSLMWTLGFIGIAGVLAVASLRVRDRMMRSFTKWIGIFSIVVTVPFLYMGPSPFPFMVGLAVASFMYYRAVTSLPIRTHVAKATG